MPAGTLTTSLVLALFLSLKRISAGISGLLLSGRPIPFYRHRLFRNDVFGLRTFLSLGHFHRDLLTFFQGLESFHLDRSVVYEYILTAFSLDETKSLVIIEPLDGSFNSFA